MYAIDALDRVVERADLPPPAVGAPLPRIAKLDSGLGILYLTDTAGPGPFREVHRASFDRPDARAARLWMPVARRVRIGGFDEHTADRHPLHARGLVPHGIFEVTDSSWLRLELGIPVSAVADGTWKHVIATFRDGYVECACRGVEGAFVRDPASEWTRWWTPS